MCLRDSGGAMRLFLHRRVGARTSRVDSARLPCLRKEDKAAVRLGQALRSHPDGEQRTRSWSRKVLQVRSLALSCLRLKNTLFPKHLSEQVLMWDRVRHHLALGIRYGR